MYVIIKCLEASHEKHSQGEIILPGCKIAFASFESGRSSIPGRKASLSEGSLPTHLVMTLSLIMDVAASHLKSKFLSFKLEDF